MKKLFFTITLLLSLMTSLHAHHMAQYDGAGENIPEFSPHLDMVFY